jgi:phospholipid/cholesterol/gamma-HCH transport system substrate-binding protein
MSQSRVQLKVGIFLLLGFVLLGALTILFSRSTPFYKDYYELRLKSGNVGGIKSGAKVLMRGVQVGNVKGTALNEGGRTVTIFLKIETQHKLYSDARFEIEQAGFLGDQFIAIYPTDDLGYVLTNRADVVAKPPFNMQEAVAVATEMLMKISQTTTNLNAAVSDVRRLVLTEDKLKSLGGSLERLNTMTSEAEATMQQLRLLVSNNAAPVSAAVSNLNLFTTQLPPLADYVHSIVATNETSLNSALRNLEAASVSLTNVLSDLENGQGVAGRLLRDETLAANLSAIAQNLSTTTSNLNTRGLWGIMWKQKLPPAPKTNAPAKSK